MLHEDHVSYFPEDIASLDHITNNQIMEAANRNNGV